jgi:hypothetical protein
MPRSKQNKEDVSLKTKIAALPKDELVQMILACANKYPEFKRELMVRFDADKAITLDTIRKDIARAFPDVVHEEYSTDQIATQLTIILKSVEEAPDHIKAEVYWAAADRVLKELNEYGMQDESLEELAADILEGLVECFRHKAPLQQRKQAVIASLMDYYVWGNSGMVDNIYEAVHNLCSEKSDYLIVIAKLESKAKTSSYDRDLLAQLYETIGDEAAQLKTLERHLEYGMDYWRLAEFWIKKGDRDKALKVVQEGIAKGEGRKNELYDYLQKHYEERRDHGRIFQLLQSKLEKNDLSQWENLKKDPSYQCLQRHYTATRDYQGQVKLLELRLSSKRIDLDLYKDAEKTLDAEDWPAFEKELLNNLEKAKPKRGSFGAWAGESSEAEKVLAEIFVYKNDLTNLFETVKNHHDLLVKYEKQLLPFHPDFYLKHYRARIEQLINYRGRENYKTAVQYAHAVKMIYQEILQQPKEWEQYLTKLRSENKPLRALQEEFRRL